MPLRSSRRLNKQLQKGQNGVEKLLYTHESSKNLEPQTSNSIKEQATPKVPLFETQETKHQTSTEPKTQGQKVADKP